MDGAYRKEPEVQREKADVDRGKASNGQGILRDKTVEQEITETEEHKS